MFQEHCTRAHIECKLRLNNSFVSDFRRNSRRSPSTAISVFFISAPPFEPGIFHGECSQADGNFFFFSISWNLQGGKVELKIIHWNNVDNIMYVQLLWKWLYGEWYFFSLYKNRFECKNLHLIASIRDKFVIYIKLLVWE